MNNRFFLSEGLVISRHGRTLEYFRRCGSMLQFSDIETGLVDTLSEAEFYEEYRRKELIILPKTVSTPDELLMPNDDETAIEEEGRCFDLSEIKSQKYKDGMLRRHKYIVGMHKAGISRGQLYLIEDEIPRIAKAINDPHPPGRITVSTWMRNYERRHGSVFAVIDKRGLRDRRVHRSSEHDELIGDLVKQHYMCCHPLSINEIHGKYTTAVTEFNQLLTASGRTPENPISERTLYRIVGGLNKYDVAIAQFGRQQARNIYRFLKGHLNACRPLQFIEIDHALLDIFVIDDRTMIPIGRPWFTVFRDRYTGVIVGLFISFAGPSVDSIFAGLRHSLYPHDRALALWPDIETKLPFGLAETYVSDRGADFLSLRYRLGITQLGADYEYCERRTPWHKGPVERFFRTLSGLLETMPGRTFPGLKERRDYDSAKHAVVRFSVLVWIIYKWAADAYNNNRTHTKLASRIERFNEGILAAPPAGWRNPQAIETILGERHQSCLRHDGLTFSHMHYIGMDLEDLWRHRGPRKRDDKIVWHLNSANLGAIQVLDPRTNTFFNAPNSRPDYAEGLSLIQHKYLKKMAGSDLRHAREPADILIRTMQSIRDRIGDELAAKETTGKKRLARLAGIDSDAVISGERRSVADPFNRDGNRPQGESHSSPDKDAGPSTKECLERTFTDVPTFGWGVM